MVYKFEHGTIDIIGIDGKNSFSDGYMYYIVNGYKEKRAKMHFRPCKSIFDHAGIYFIARFMDNSTKRIYLTDLVEYR